MANVFAFESVDLISADLHDLVLPITSTDRDGMSASVLRSEFERDGIPLSLVGTINPALNSYAELFHPNDLNQNTSLILGGHDLDSGSSLGSSGGRVYMMAEMAMADSAVEYLTFGINGFDISASSLWSAIQSTSTTDDAALMDQVFAGNDTFILSSEADRANGGAGNDVMRGNSGADVLWGGAGSDTITGGSGRDLLTGGTGADRFIFNATKETGTSATTADQITDFTHGTDRIDLSAIDASTVLAANNAFTFIGAAAFGIGSGGEIRFEQVNAAGTANDYTLVYLDTDADTAAEAVIRLNGLVTLSATDFVL